jgi:DNA topoisomerase-3
MELLKELVGKAEVVLNGFVGGDGDLGGWLALREAGWTGEILRVAPSAMDADAISRALANPIPEAAGKLRRAADQCRAEADFLFGTNMSRVLTVALGKGTAKRHKFPFGRSKAAALGMLVDQEDEVRSWTPRALLQLAVETRTDGGAVVDLLHVPAEPCSDRAALTKMGNAMKGRRLRLSVERTTESVPPPALPQMPDVVMAAGKWDWSSSRTWEVARAVQTKGLISLPEAGAMQAAEDPDAVVRGLARMGLAEFEVPGAARGARPARPVVPTGAVVDVSTLPPDEARLLRWLAARWVADRMPDRVIGTVEARGDVDGVLLAKTWRKTTAMGWVDAFVNPATGLHEDVDVVLETAAPDIADGVEVTVASFRPLTRDDAGQPSEMTEPWLLARMAAAKIGTDASRAFLVGDLVDGLYATMATGGLKLAVTDKGRHLVTELRREGLGGLLSPETTAKWDKAVALVASGKLEPERFAGVVRESIEQWVAKLKAAKLAPFHGDKDGNAIEPPPPVDWAAKLAAGTVLEVPFERKDEAKALGARYDGSDGRKCWVALKDADLAPFRAAGFLKDGG